MGDPRLDALAELELSLTAHACYVSGRVIGALPRRRLAAQRRGAGEGGSGLRWAAGEDAREQVAQLLPLLGGERSDQLSLGGIAVRGRLTEKVLAGWR